jgi:hypothetical protein
MYFPIATTCPTCYSSTQNYKLIDNYQILVELMQETRKIFGSEICALMNSGKYKRPENPKERKGIRYLKNLQE